MAVCSSPALSSRARSRCSGPGREVAARPGQRLLESSTRMVRWLSCSSLARCPSFSATASPLSPGPAEAALSPHLAAWRWPCSRRPCGPRAAGWRRRRSEMTARRNTEDCGDTGHAPVLAPVPVPTSCCLVPAMLLLRHCHGQAGARYLIRYRGHDIAYSGVVVHCTQPLEDTRCTLQCVSSNGVCGGCVLPWSVCGGHSSTSHTACIYISPLPGAFARTENTAIDVTNGQSVVITSYQRIRLSTHSSL